jgi:hypothetical protein
VRNDREFDYYRHILSQAPPKLAKILQSYKFASYGPTTCISLFNIRLLLNYSWDELREAICSLPSIMDCHPKALLKLIIAASDPLLLLELDFDVTLRELAFGCIRIIAQSVTYKFPHHWRRVLLPKSSIDRTLS